MTAITTFLNQKAGMIVCKSGHTTGITCGEITNGNATHNGVAGWIEEQDPVYGAARPIRPAPAVMSTRWVMG